MQIVNPAAHPSVRKYHSPILEEQAKERIFSIQAVPIVLDKLKIICTHLRNSIVRPKIKSSERYIFCRDQAFFSVNFFSGDRGSDLGRAKSSDLLSFPDGNGFVVKKVFGKTLRGNGENVFGLNQDRVLLTVQ